MKKIYNSKFYNKPIEIENIDGEILVIITNNNGKKYIYSWYDIIEEESNSSYINKMLLGSFLNKTPKKVLILGTGGGSLIKFLEDHINNIEIFGVDIDETMIKISKEVMLIKSKNIFTFDANLFLDKLISEGNNNFDSIFIDCYNSDSKIPNNLITKDFFKKCSKVLEKDGIITINMADFEENEVLYKKMNSNIVSVLDNKKYDIFLSTKNDLGNIIGIYNLDKNYSAQEYNSNFIKQVNNGKIKNNFKIIENSFIAEKDLI